MRKLILCAFLCLISFNTNASVIRSLNGITYEWMELAETFQLGRDQVELRMADPDDILYGYQYASRALVNELLLSYTTWDGLVGWHGDPAETSGMLNFFNDLGETLSSPGTGVPKTYNTVDGYTVSYDEGMGTGGLYGLENECGPEGSTDISCLFTTTLMLTVAGDPAMVFIDGSGFDLSVDITIPADSYGAPSAGSFVVRLSSVPVPPAVWLFGSGLLGLIGLAMRKARI